MQCDKVNANFVLISQTWKLKIYGGWLIFQSILCCTWLFMHLYALVREVYFCSRRWLTQRSQPSKTQKIGDWRLLTPKWNTFDTFQAWASLWMRGHEYCKGRMKWNTRKSSGHTRAAIRVNSQYKWWHTQDLCKAEPDKPSVVRAVEHKILPLFYAVGNC